MNIKNEVITENNYEQFLKTYYKRKYKKKFDTVLSQKFSVFFGIILLITSILMTILLFIDLMNLKPSKLLGISTAIYFIFMVLTTSYSINAYDTFYKMHHSTQIIIILQKLSSLIYNNKSSNKDFTFLLNSLRYSLELNYMECKKNHLLYNTKQDEELFAFIELLRNIKSNSNNDTQLSEFNDFIKKFKILILQNCPDIVLKNKIKINDSIEFSDLGIILYGFYNVNEEPQESNLNSRYDIINQIFGKDKFIFIAIIIVFLCNFILTAFEFPSHGIIRAVLVSLNSICVLLLPYIYFRRNKKN